MALAEPLDLLTDFPGWVTEPFRLMYRKEFSRHASGATRSKDLGMPLWRGSWQSKKLSANTLDRWLARLSHAEGSQLRFLAWHSARCWPIKDPAGAVLGARPRIILDFVNDIGVAYYGTFAIHTIGADRQSARLSGLPRGMQLSIGDMFSVGRSLHRFVEDAAAPLGTSDLATVEPHFWPDAAQGQAVTLHKPACWMTIDAGSISAPVDLATGRGSISFTATEAR